MIATPASNEAAFSEGWLRTGDLGRLDADGYLFITGRLEGNHQSGRRKDRRRRLVEQVLLEHPAVAEAVSLWHSPCGARRDGRGRSCAPNQAQDLDQPVKQIRDFAATRLARFEVPQQIVIVDQIPLGAQESLVRRDLAAALGL